MGSTNGLSRSAPAFGLWPCKGKDHPAWPKVARLAAPQLALRFFSLTLLACLLAGVAVSLARPVWATAGAGHGNSGKKSQVAPYALLVGTVWTPDSRPAAGVKIKIRRANETKFRWERVSDSHGEFAVRLPAEAADYVVVAEPGGKHSSVEAPVHFNFDERTDLGLHLKD
jgi:hypothetical protein